MTTILGIECEDCIKKFGHSEITCAFCENKEFYRDYIKEVKEVRNL